MLDGRRVQIESVEHAGIAVLEQELQDLRGSRHAALWRVVVFYPGVLDVSVPHGAGGSGVGGLGRIHLALYSAFHGRHRSLDAGAATPRHCRSVTMPAWRAT